MEVEDAGAAAVMRGGMIEVRLRGASVSIEPGTDPAMVTTILMALRAAR